ncbi:hypothetical protein GY45DRAFT_1430879 [Cubamyces sp. BRFM 1775]|nr:hypothetical protein GY45DRAFT_1430879 [Cubamyces sp. BRFM 1775]
MSHSTVISIGATKEQHMAACMDEFPCSGSPPALDGFPGNASLKQANQVDVVIASALATGVTEDLGMRLGERQGVPSLEVVDVSRSSSVTDVFKSAVITVTKCLEEGDSEGSLQEVLVVERDVRTSIAPSFNSEGSDDDEDEDDMYIPRGLETQGTRIRTKPGVGSPINYAKPASLINAQVQKAQNVPEVPPPSRVQAQGGAPASAGRVLASQPGTAIGPSPAPSRPFAPGITITIPPPQNQPMPQATASGHATAPIPSLRSRLRTALSNSSRSLSSKAKRVLSIGRQTEQTSNGGTPSMSPQAAVQTQKQEQKTKNGRRL